MLARCNWKAITIGFAAHTSLPLRTKGRDNLCSMLYQSCFAPVIKVGKHYNWGKGLFSQSVLLELQENSLEILAIQSMVLEEKGFYEECIGRLKGERTYEKTMKLVRLLGKYECLLE